MPAVEIFVQKNDGLGLKMPVSIDMDAEGGWDSIKYRCARKLFKEEELYSIQGSHEIKMFRCPSGNDEESRRGKAGALRMIRAESTWSVEIFGGPFRTKQDVGDELVRNITSATHSMEAQQGLVGAMGALGGASRMSDCFLDPNLHIHVTTFLPMAKHPDCSPSDYDCSLSAMLRCRRWLQTFAARGHKVQVMSMQSVLLPASDASPSAILKHGPQNLYKGVYDTAESDAGSRRVTSTPAGGGNDSGSGGDGAQGNRWVQCARVWFCFENERTVHVQKRGGHIGLQPVRQEEGWIVVRALEGSPCAAAGMPVTAVYLTHVNEEDVSPHSFPSLAPKSKEAVTWEKSVQPLVEKSDSFSFTFFE